MKAFGLTGNIGCGKSTVATLLGEFPDVVILDCDRIAKEIMPGNEHREQINAHLSTNVFPEGKTDFKTIATIIFNEPEKRKLLEELIHPLVWATVRERVDSSGEGKICVVESALIFETNSANKFAAIIVATCNTEEQFRRLMENRAMDSVQIQARIDQQIPSSEKEAMAQFVIHTDRDFEQLRGAVSDLYLKLRALPLIS